jgi:hypothetical protein
MLNNTEGLNRHKIAFQNQESKFFIIIEINPLCWLIFIVQPTQEHNDCSSQLNIRLHAVLQVLF